MRFKKARGADAKPTAVVKATADEAEAMVLRRCAGELLELIGDAELEQDPLAALVGMPAGEVAPPEDPALARLLPDAYAQDPSAATEFRRYTDADLRSGKRAAARTVLATVPEGGGPVLLDREQAAAWLGCLNDLRLVLGTRLEVTEETDLEELDPHDPRAQALHIYGWLAWLQESLLSCLSPRIG